MRFRFDFQGSDAIPLSDGNYRLLGHDYQIGNWWTNKNKNGYNYDGKNRFAKTQGGNPETVATYYKEDRVAMTVPWQWFAFRQMIFSAYGHFDEAKLTSEEYNLMVKAWASTMHGGRVITNNKGWNDGRRDDIQGINLDANWVMYMCLGMGGNVVKLLDDTIYEKGRDYAQCYKFETLDGSKPPPNPEDVNFLTHPHLFSRATVCRYVTDDKEWETLKIQLGNRYQHVIQFPQFEFVMAHTILMNISNQGYNFVPVQRCLPYDASQGIPNPYNPPKQFRTL